MREFIDRAGSRWQVFEVSNETVSVGRPNYLAPALRNGWLVFDNGAERRRLAPFPEEWASFPVSALLVLLDAASRVERRTGRERSAESGDGRLNASMSDTGRKGDQYRA